MASSHKALLTSRRLFSGSSTGAPLLLYGSEQSLYTGKVRAYLRYSQRPFVEVLCTRDVYKSTIIPAVGWPVVPVVAGPHGRVLQDTTQIITTLDEEAALSSRTIKPPGPKQRFVSQVLPQPQLQFSPCRSEFKRPESISG
jgi:hypothetical protein